MRLIAPSWCSDKICLFIVQSCVPCCLLSRLPTSLTAFLIKSQEFNWFHIILRGMCFLFQLQTQNKIQIFRFVSNSEVIISWWVVFIPIALVFTTVKIGFKHSSSFHRWTPNIKLRSIVRSTNCWREMLSSPGPRHKFLPKFLYDLLELK